MKKIITYIFLVFSILSFSNTFNENEDERTILKKEQRLEQERIQEKYENSKDSYQKDTKIEVDKNEYMPDYTYPLIDSYSIDTELCDLLFETKSIYKKYT